MSQPRKCGHASCSCICTDGKKFCCQMCEDSKNVTDLKCDCKHSCCG